VDRRLVSTTLTVIGIVLVAAGLVVMLGIAPGYRAMSGSMTLTQRFEGVLRTSVDLATLEDTRSSRLTVQSTVAVTETHGDSALLRQESTARIPQGRLDRTIVHYALDRRSMECTDDYPEQWGATTGFWPRLGLMGIWPYQVLQRDYELWVDAYRATVPLRYAGEVEHSASGLIAYRFAASGDQQPMAEEEVEFLDLPTEIATEQLQTLQDDPAANPVLRRMLPDVLETWQEETVPVGYSWEFHTTYWVEPRTGVVLDMRMQEILRVGIAEEVVVATPLAALPAAQRAALEVVVEESEYEASEATIAAAVSLVDERVSALRLFSTTLPIILVVVGLGVGTAGSVMLARRRRSL
jgi:hypothetical protein